MSEHLIIQDTEFVRPGLNDSYDVMYNRHWECQECGAFVADLERHGGWHDNDRGTH